MLENLDWTPYNYVSTDGTVVYMDKNLWNALLSMFLGLAFFLLVACVTLGTHLLYDWHTSKESSPMKPKPFCQDYHDHLKEYKNLKSLLKARMYFIKDKCQISNLSTNKLTSLMATIFKNDNPEVPKHVRVISIKMDGFKYGNECHDFEPINGRAPGSEFCYKSFGNNRIQGTFYKENDVYYLAGFCIYVKNEFVMGFNFREEDIRWLLGGTPYPARTRGIRNAKSEMDLGKRIMELKIDENQKTDYEMNDDKIWVYLPSQMQCRYSGTLHEPVTCKGSQECSMCHINDLRLLKPPAEAEDPWWLKGILVVLSGMLFFFAILVCALDCSIQWLRSKNNPARIVLEDYEVVSNKTDVDDEDAVSCIESPEENDSEFNFLESSSSEEVPKGLEDVEWIVRTCPRLERPVMTTQGFHVAIHQEWSHLSNEMKMEDCVECFENGE